MAHGTTMLLEQMGGKPLAIIINVFKPLGEKILVLQELDNIEREASFKVQNATTAHYLHVIQHVNGARPTNGLLNSR